MTEPDTTTSTSTIHRKMMAEFLDKIKDWPTDAKRTFMEAIGRMLEKPDPKKGKGGSLDAFGMWVGDGTAE